MTTIPTGTVKFSDIQTALGGTNPIKFSEYYKDATEGYSSGIDGIPNRFSAIKVSNFRGKRRGLVGSYGFLYHRFTNAGASGRNGPTLQQCRTEYASATWAQDSNNNWLNMTSNNGIQVWKVPATASYSIHCAGASGGLDTHNNVNVTSGRIISAQVNLTENDTLHIVVGQQGESRMYQTGGGGGTFVFRNGIFGRFLMAAGGGGGSTHTQIGSDGNFGPSGRNAGGGSNADGGTGGSGGTGGTNGTGGSGGGGVLFTGNNGESGSAGTNGGTGGNGGASTQTSGGGGGAGVGLVSSAATFIGGAGSTNGTAGGHGGNGGFGGGGGAGRGNDGGGGGGGGGGYSGGGGGGGSFQNAGGGGGGGSFVADLGIVTASNLNWGINSGHGWVEIQSSETVTPR